MLNLIGEGKVIVRSIGVTLGVIKVKIIVSDGFYKIICIHERHGNVFGSIVFLVITGQIVWLHDDLETPDEKVDLWWRSSGDPISLQ